MICRAADMSRNKTCVCGLLVSMSNAQSVASVLIFENKSLNSVVNLPLHAAAFRVRYNNRNTFPQKIAHQWRTAGLCEVQALYFEQLFSLCG